MMNILKKYPSFSQFLRSGGRIPNAFPPKDDSPKSSFQGKKHPTYFDMLNEFPEDSPKQAEHKRKVRVQFKSDVAEDYFTRDIDPGDFTLSCDKIPNLIYEIRCHEGVWTVNILIDDKFQISETYHFQYEAYDETLLASSIESLKGNFYISVKEKTDSKKSPSQPGNRKKNATNKGEDGNAWQTIPPLNWVTDEKWEEHDMDNRRSALRVTNYGGDSYGYFVNEDNASLKLVLKETKHSAETVKHQFGIGLQFFALSYITRHKEKEAEDIKKAIADFSDAIAPVIIPVIDGLAGIELEEE